jgi:hypothetical protein
MVLTLEIAVWDGGFSRDHGSTGSEKWESDVKVA